MIITRKYARHLITSGKARIIGLTNAGNESAPVLYVGLDRLDLQRVDHVAGHLADERDWHAGRAVTTLDCARAA